MGKVYMFQDNPRPESSVCQDRSLRSQDFPSLCQGVARYWILVRRDTEGCPESPDSGDRSLQSGLRRRQVSVGTAESPARPESPVPPTGISGPPMKSRRWRGTRPLSGGRPELGRSLRPTHTGVSDLSSDQRLVHGEGYKYPSPTLERVARPEFQEP